MHRQLCLSAFVRVSAFALLLAVFTVAFAADDPLPPNVVSMLKGLTEPVYATAFTPDGKHVITASFDKTLKVWETDTGKEFKTFGGPAGHQNLVLSVALSADGALVASGSSDNTAKIWDFPTTKPIREFVQPDAVNAVALSPDGTRIAGAGKDGIVKVWTTADGKEAFSLPGHVGGATGVAFSANGQLLVTAAADKMLRFWNPANGQPVAVIGAHTAPLTAVAINPNNAAVYTAGEDGQLKFWTVPPVVPRTLTAPHADAVTSVALSADGNSILSGSADKTVRLSTFANGQMAKTFTAPAAIQSTALAAERATVVAAGTRRNNRLLLWNVADAKVLSDVVAHGGPVTGVAFHPQSTQLLTAGGDGLVKLWALPAAPRTVTHPDAVLSVFATADGKRLMTGGQDKIVRSWNMAAPAAPERQFTGHTAPVSVVLLSPNGQNLVSAGEDGTIRFWNQQNGQTTEMIGAHSMAITSLSYNPNGQQLLSASADGSLKLWQLPGNMPKPLIHPDQVTSAVLNPDGSRLLTGCGDKQVRLWNLSNGQMEKAFPALTLAVNAVAMNVNGNQIAAGGADKTLVVWNVADAKEVKKFTLAAATCRAWRSVPTVSSSPKRSGGQFDPCCGSGHYHRYGNEGHHRPHRRGDGPDIHGQGRSSHRRERRQDNSGVEYRRRRLEAEDGTRRRGALPRSGARTARRSPAAAADKAVKVWSLADGKLTATIPTNGEVPRRQLQRGWDAAGRRRRGQPCGHLRHRR